jgi:hypothetical protein
LARSKTARPAPEEPAPKRDGRWLIAVALAAVAGFLILAVGNIVTTSPTSDETAHLVAGYSYLTQHDFRLNPEHPPLLKSIAALPLLAMKIWPEGFRDPGDGKVHFALFHEAWAMAMSNPAMAEWSVSQYLLYGMRDETLSRVGGDPIRPPTDVAYSRSDFLNDPGKMFTASRIMMLLLAIALATAIFFWSLRLWGLPGAVLSVLLFSFDPSFIAHSGLVATDVGAACLMFIAAYFFWRTCRAFSRVHVVVFAMAFGLAQISKFSAVLLIPIVVVLAVMEGIRSRDWKRPAIALASAAVATIFVVWAAYGFRYSTAPDPQAAQADEQAARATLQMAVLDAPNIHPSGHLPLSDALAQWAGSAKLKRDSPNGYTEADLRNAKRTAPVGTIGKTIEMLNDHHLLPESFLFGVAWTGATSVTRSSYLKGEYSNYGFPSFFFWTLLYKTTIPAIVLTIAGMLAAFRSKRGDLAFLIIPAAAYAVFAFTSSIHIGHRHFFPVLPFAYVLAGALGTWVFAKRSRAVVATVALALTANVVLLPRPLSVVNRHLSYLNEIAGGPVDGFEKLSDSNFDWGQDVKRLGEWVQAQKLEKPINLVVFGNADPRYYGIRYNNLRMSDYPKPSQPGYVAISQMDYLGLLFDAEHRNTWRNFLARTHATRVGSAGYSILIYRVDQLP